MGEVGEARCKGVDGVGVGGRDGGGVEPCGRGEGDGDVGVGADGERGFVLWLGRCGEVLEGCDGGAEDGPFEHGAG